MLFKRCRSFLTVIICVFSFILCQEALAADPVFHDTDGKVVQLKNLRGKWVIVNYWAAWCSSCVSEVPDLNHFYKTHLDKDVVLYGVNYDQLPLSSLKYAMNSIDIHFPVIVEDPNEAWHLGDIPVLPATFIINPQGKVVKIIMGANSEESLIQSLQELQHT